MFKDSLFTIAFLFLAQSDSAQKLKIGVFVPLTGPGAAWGVDRFLRIGKSFL